MAENEDAVLEAGLQALQDLLGTGWRITPLTSAAPTQLELPLDARLDAVVTLAEDGGHYSTDVLVEAKQTVTPAEIRRSLVPKLSLLRQLRGDVPALVVSPWVSPQAQQVLRKWGIGYLDLTGNVWFRSTRPAVVLHLHGATRAPQSAKRPRQRLTGTQAGSLIRLLVDVAPPYRPVDIAKAAGLSLGYVTRLLDAMEGQLLIEREGREITRVDWQGLLRARAQETSLLKANPPVPLLAPNGINPVLARLRNLPSIQQRNLVVTGSYAAAAVAPYAVGGQLMLYIPNEPQAADRIAEGLGLLRVDESPDVQLLQAGNNVVFERTRTVDGIEHVALSQLALDCLSGPGRMPAEGDAVVQYMTDHETTWRIPDLSALHRPTGH